MQQSIQNAFDNIYMGIVMMTIVLNPKYYSFVSSLKLVICKPCYYLQTKQFSGIPVLDPMPCNFEKNALSLKRPLSL